MARLSVEERKKAASLLQAWTAGDQGALALLTPIVYDELRRLAHHYMKRAGRTARAERVSLDADAVMCRDRSEDFVSLDDALNALAQRAPRKARVVELRFFGQGLVVSRTDRREDVSGFRTLDARR